MSRSASKSRERHLIKIDRGIATGQQVSEPPSFFDYSYIHRRHTAALCPDHDRIDLHVGKMIAVRGEDVRQSRHRAFTGA